MAGLNVASSSSLAVTLNPAGEFLAASPSKANVISSGFYSLPSTGAHAAKPACPTGALVVAAGKPVKNDPRTAFTTVVSGLGVSPCSPPPAAASRLVTGPTSLNVVGSVSPKLHRSGQVVDSHQPMTVQQLTEHLRERIGELHSVGSTPTSEHTYLQPDQMLNMRRQSAPAAHIASLALEPFHAPSPHVQPDGLGRCGAPLGIQRHHSHVGLSSLAEMETSPQPIRIASVIQPPVQRIAPRSASQHYVMLSANQAQANTASPQLSPQPALHTVGTRVMFPVRPQLSTADSVYVRRASLQVGIPGTAQVANQPEVSRHAVSSPPPPVSSLPTQQQLQPLPSVQTHPHPGPVVQDKVLLHALQCQAKANPVHAASFIFVTQTNRQHRFCVPVIQLPCLLPVRYFIFVFQVTKFQMFVEIPENELLFPSKFKISVSRN